MFQKQQGRQRAQGNLGERDREWGHKARGKTFGSEGHCRDFGFYSQWSRKLWQALSQGTIQSIIAALQMRNDGGGPGWYRCKFNKMWSNSGYILKLELTGYTDSLAMGIREREICLELLERSSCQQLWKEGDRCKRFGEWYQELSLVIQVWSRDAEEKWGLAGDIYLWVFHLEMVFKAKRLGERDHQGSVCRQRREEVQGLSPDPSDMRRKLQKRWRMTEDVRGNQINAYLYISHSWRNSDL